LIIELVPKLINYAPKRMVRKLCLRWNSLNYNIRKKAAFHKQRRKKSKKEEVKSK
jgi:hypothetical protein